MEQTNDAISIRFKSMVRSSPISGTPVRTTLAILKVNQEELTGCVTRSVHDVDVKVVGQREALKRAIESYGNISLDKGQRKQIWEKFSNKSKATRKLLHGSKSNS